VHLRAYLRLTAQDDASGPVVRTWHAQAFYNNGLWLPVIDSASRCFPSKSVQRKEAVKVQRTAELHADTDMSATQTLRRRQGSWRFCLKNVGWDTARPPIYNDDMLGWYLSLALMDDVFRVRFGAL
jgi:hypothetical protein